MITLQACQFEWQICQTARIPNNSLSLGKHLYCLGGNSVDQAWQTPSVWITLSGTRCGSCSVLFRAGSVRYESDSEETQSEIQFCKVCQNIGLVEICSFRREPMAGMPPVLLGVFDHCKATCTQIRDLISNYRHWVLLKVSPAGLVLRGSIRLMHFLCSCSYCSILGAEGAACHPKSGALSPTLLQPQQLQIRALGSSQGWGVHLQKAGCCIRKGEQVPLCRTTKEPSLTLNLCLNGPTRSRLKPFLDQSLKCWE